MKTKFRILCVLVGVILVASAVFIPTSVRADGTIQWEGNGAENLPCEGGHWVVAPSFGITGATLNVNGQSYTMAQSGQGSWSADSVGYIDTSVQASVSFTGDGDERNHLQLSNCIGQPPTPTGTTVPPTQTPTGTIVPPTPTPAPPEQPTGASSEGWRFPIVGIGVALIMAGLFIRKKKTG